VLVKDTLHDLDTTTDFRQLELVHLAKSPREPRGKLGHPAAHLATLFLPRGVGNAHRQHLGVLGEQLLERSTGKAHERPAYPM